MTTDSAGQGPVERRVRPVAQVQRMGSFQGVPHYGCLLNLEAEHRMKVNDPLYGQAELDAAVAAERERCAAIARRWGETHADGVTVNARNAASKIARGIEGPNVADKRHGTVLRDGSA